MRIRDHGTPDAMHGNGQRERTGVEPRRNRPVVSFVFAVVRAAAWRDVPVVECRARGESPLARWLSLVHLGDAVSVELAHLNGVEPPPVAVIEELKRRLEE